jgi:DNA (cytosine-5)-methyltransferase 1
MIYMKSFTVSSLFSGIGGFEKGIIDAAKESGIHIEFVFASEIEKNACKIYKNHFWSAHLHDDITTIPSSRIPEHNILCAGFPCPSFSQAGNRKGFDDCRGQLFFEICRILRDKKPEYYMLENVKNLVNHNQGRTIERIAQIIGELGYTFEFQILNARDFGIPQNRERTIITGHLRGRSGPEILPILSSERVYSKPDWGGSEKGEWFWGADYCSTITKNYSKGVHCGGETYVLHGNVVLPEDYILFYIDSNTGEAYNGTNTGSRNEDDERIVICPYCGVEFGSDACKCLGISSIFDTGDHEHIFLRRLTPLECERLQGFPDNWTKGVSDTARYQCLGNAVPPVLIREVMKKIISRAKTN